MGRDMFARAEPLFPLADMWSMSVCYWEMHVPPAEDQAIFPFLSPFPFLPPSPSSLPFVPSPPASPIPHPRAKAFASTFTFAPTPFHYLPSLISRKKGGEKERKGERKRRGGTGEKEERWMVMRRGEEMALVLVVVGRWYSGWMSRMISVSVRLSVSFSSLWSVIDN